MAIDHTQPPAYKKPLILHEALIPYFLLFLAFSIPSHRYLISAVIVPLLVLSYHHLLQTTSLSPPAGFVIGAFVIFHAYYSLILLVFRDPRQEFKRTDSHVVTLASNGLTERDKKDEGEPYPVHSLKRRMGWAMDLIFNLRGIGWNWVIHPIPPLSADETASLRLFLRRRVVRLLVIWAWLDATMFWMHHIDRAYFLPDGNSYENPKTVREPVYAGPFVPSSKPQRFPVPRRFPEVPGGVLGLGYGLVLHSFRTILQGALIYTCLNGVYTELAVIAASIGGVVGVGGPRGWRRRYLDWRSWPDLFGRWSEGDWGHGLTGWWGKAWHGMFKYVFTSPSRYITHTLNLPKRSPTTTVIHLLSPFLMSAMLHFSGSYTRSSDGWGSAQFFIVQPIGIAIEQAFLYCYYRLAPSKSSPSTVRKCLERWVPYLWVISWFILTSKPFFEDLRYGGVWGMQPVPVSVWKGVYGVREGWWCWRRNTSMGWREWWEWDVSVGGWGVRI